jgi:hypothetical protein
MALASVQGERSAQDCRRHGIGFATEQIVRADDLCDRGGNHADAAAELEDPIARLQRRMNRRQLATLVGLLSNRFQMDARTDLAVEGDQVLSVSDNLIKRELRHGARRPVPARNRVSRTRPAVAQ